MILAHSRVTPSASTCNDDLITAPAPRGMMETSRTPLRLTKRTKAVLLLVYGLFLASLLLVSAEVVLRLKGWRPWRMAAIPVRVEPGGRLFREHPSLGYDHIPGRFTVDLGNGISFRVTHSASSHRITLPVDSSATSAHKEEIWIFGCSYTYGWTLDDEQTYPWLLQERFPEYKVVNFGTNGYGTVHSLVQFREALESKRPRVAILTYADFHDERNTFLRVRRKFVAPWNKLGPLRQPYARLDGQGRLRFSMAEVTYREFPLMRYSALAHYIESKYNEYEDKLVRSHAVSEAIVDEMARIAAEHGVRFVVAGIARVGQRPLYAMLDFARERGIPTVDISLDPQVKGHRNLPDNHPSALAHRKYADRLEGVLNEILRSGDSRAREN